MSIPTLQGLQTALSGLLAEQQALDIAGHNIANANTEGYSRETAVLETNRPIEVPAMSVLTGKGGQLGTGVSVETYTRIRNAYLDAQYRTQNSALSGSTTEAEELQQAQAAFNEPSSSGIASQLSALLPQALSNGVMSAGGLGLAAQLTREIQVKQGAPTQASGGVSA